MNGLDDVGCWLLDGWMKRPPFCDETETETDTETETLTSTWKQAENYLILTFGGQQSSLTTRFVFV